MKPSAADRDRTRLLAEEMTSLAHGALAPEDVEQVKRLLLDHVGVAWRGSDMPWSRALTDWAATLGNGEGNGSGCARSSARLCGRHQASRLWSTPLPLTEWSSTTLTTNR